MWLSLQNIKMGRLHLAITVLEGNRKVKISMHFLVFDISTLLWNMDIFQLFSSFLVFEQLYGSKSQGKAIQPFLFLKKLKFNSQSPKKLNMENNAHISRTSLPFYFRHSFYFYFFWYLIGTKRWILHYFLGQK